MTVIEDYIKEVFGHSAEVRGIRELGLVPIDEELKGFGYGKPYQIDVMINGECKSVVLSSMRPEGGFGHDHFSDRAQILIWQHAAFGKLPRHVRSLDVGYFTTEGGMRSAGDSDEYFILMDKVAGVEYFKDLDRIKNTGVLDNLDVARAEVLSDYLVDIHKVRRSNPVLYTRRIRDLIGHGELIMGLIDSYPSDFEFFSPDEFLTVEKRCVDWRYALKDRCHRLCVVHGDYHPWNVMFRDDRDFTVLDRSRGECGEAADDITAMSINYLFYSVQKYGKLSCEFKTLFSTFIKNYLDKTGDEELLEVVQPFYAFRGLVVASPLWYPHLDSEVRGKLFNFVQNILEVETFDCSEVNSLLEG
jgi:hypothetical protein